MECDRNQFKLVLVTLFLLFVVIGGVFSSKLVKCDYQKYPSGGCRSSNQVCDQKTQLCKCGSKSPIALTSDICLQQKSINETCMGTVQCRHIPNAGCFGLDTEFKDDFWILLWVRFGFSDPGKCMCDRANSYEYNHNSKSCVHKPIVLTKCRSDSECYSKLSNTICGRSGRCECKSGFVYNTAEDSCQLPHRYDDYCLPNEGCAGQDLVCVKSQCKCKAGYHFDKYHSNKCEPNFFAKCLDGEDLNDCLESIKGDRNLNKLSEFDLIEPPRIYSIFVILALWICLLFILGNAKKGLKLVEQAVRRDQSSQYLQCDTCVVQSVDDTDPQDLGLSQMSLHSDVSSANNQNYPPPTFDEIYPNGCQSFDDPPTYEEVVQFDKNKGLVV